jgi:hypothetical protein
MTLLQTVNHAISWFTKLWAEYHTGVTMTIWEILLTRARNGHPGIQDRSQSAHPPGFRLSRPSHDLHYQAQGNVTEHGNNIVTIYRTSFLD